MRLTRLHVDAALAPGDVLELPPDTATHVAKVLRVRSGDPVVLFNGDGRESAAVIDAVRGSRVSVAVGESRLIDRESPLPVTLLQSIPRGDRMDFIVQKATELGVARIVPIFSERSVVRLDHKQAESKCTHWRAIAASACEQCGRNRLPILDAPRRLLDYLGAATITGTRLLLDPDGGSAARGAGGGAADDRIDGAAAVEIAVGPEGGFAAAELDAFAVSGFLPVRLGPRILRTETAALAALVWLQTRSGDLR